MERVGVELEAQIRDERGFLVHSGQSGPTPRCSICRKHHFGECQKLTGGCYHCGDKGHHVRDCPKRSHVSQIIPEPTIQESKEPSKDQEKTVSTGQKQTTSGMKSLR